MPPADAVPEMTIHHDLPPEHSYERLSHPPVGGKSIPPPAPSAIPETEYVPEPPPQPFSSEDSADAIALRAAISALQFQKQKAQGDLKSLEALKTQALQDPERFRRELVAGNLKEQRHDFGAIRDVLEAPAEEGDDDDEVVLGAEEERELPASRTGIAQGSQSSLGNSAANTSSGTQAPLPRIPGPQDVVRMPPVNWDKYHIVGEPLDALHEQQRRWPGSVPGQENRGREHSVLAPYSPFYDTLESKTQQPQSNGRSGSHGNAATMSGAEPSSENRRTSRN